MKAATPDALAFGRCPAHCPNFRTCFEVASSIVAMEFAVDADLSAPVECDPADSFAVHDDRILAASAAALALSAPERGCPRYVPPTSV